MPTSHLVVIYMIMVGIFTPMLRYVSNIFPPLVQNGVRFTVGGLLILAISIFRYIKNRESLADFFLFVRQKYYLFLIVIVCMSITMVFMSLGLVYTSSFTSTMFATFGIPVTTIVAAIYFPDERKKATHFTFVIGMIVCIIGSYIFMSQGSSTQVHSTKGTIYLTISVIAQVILNNLVKYITREHSVIYTSTINSLGVGVLLLILSIFTGQFSALKTAPSWQVALLIFAGFYGIFMGMVLGFTLLKKTGISNFNILQLITPIVVAIFAYIFFNEKNITFNQVIGAIVIITGSGVCTFGRKIINYIRRKL